MNFNTLIAWYRIFDYSFVLKLFYLLAFRIFVLALLVVIPYLTWPICYSVKPDMAACFWLQEWVKSKYNSPDMYAVRSCSDRKTKLPSLATPQQIDIVV